ncbi:MAG: glycosyltransferase family 2 protein, partial [Candidatus Zixiibacteriota bacterium]
MTEPREKPLVSTIVPAMNEEGNIDEFCRLFAEMAAKAPFDVELVFVDDGSTDGTLGKIKENAARYDFIRYAAHPVNRGLTEALQTGFATARGSVYVFYPADLQYLPEDIPRLAAPVVENRADLCTGWKQGKYNKRFVSRIYNWFSRKLFGLRVHDLNSVKAFRADIVKQIFLRKDWHRYLVVLAAERGFRVVEEKIPLYPRQWGHTKFSFWRIPVGVLDMLAVKFQLTFLRKPLLFFGSLGAISFALGVLVGLFAIYLRYVQGVGERPLLYLVILLVGLGMGLFMMGFMAEGQTALKEEMTDLREKTNQLIEELRHNRLN